MRPIKFFKLLLFVAPFGLPMLGHSSSLQLKDQYQVFGSGTVNLKQVIGSKPVYMKFWATWCLDCRRELPSLEKAYRKYGDNIAMYAVNLNINETEAQIRLIQQKGQLTIPILIDDNGSIAGNFDFYGTPFHVLINRKGEVVYTTYKDDEKLAMNLASLAENKKVTHNGVISPKPTNTVIAPLGDKLTIIFISATWCDWYMEDIHPDMAKNCVEATELTKQLYKLNPNISLQGYVTSLWTEEEDLEAYQNKYSISYPLTLDKSNQAASHYNATEFPTLLVFQNNQEVKRITRFSNPDQLLNDLNNFIQTHN